MARMRAARAIAVFVAAVAIVLGPALALLAPIDEASADQPRAIRVVDGDTLRDLRSDTTYRVVNIDAPEVGRNARCTAERALGHSATRRARALVAAARRLEMRNVGRVDRYGRAVAHIIVDGRDLGQTLISEGLARPWRGRREPWCDATGALIRQAAAGD